LSLERLAQLSGYSLQEAQYAQRRLYSVAISTEHCSPEQQTQLIEALRTFGCEASASGRWIMVTRDTNKGQAVQWYRGWAQQQHIRHRLVAGIGNESNDSSLLENVDLLFVIQNSQGYADVLQKLPQAHLLISQGVQGWKEMVYVLDTY
jgi:predicted mannosyl-3-phosphoglycerate phosphatase (HAD superfamily)